MPMERAVPKSPYSLGEIAMLRSWCRGLPAQGYRDGIETVIAFGLGSGVSSIELYQLVGTDVTSDDAGVTVNIHHDRPRQIPVLDAWADDVAERAQARRHGADLQPQADRH